MEQEINLDNCKKKENVLTAVPISWPSSSTGTQPLFQSRWGVMVSHCQQNKISDPQASISPDLSQLAFLPHHRATTARMSWGPVPWDYLPFSNHHRHGPWCVPRAAFSFVLIYQQKPIFSFHPQSGCLKCFPPITTPSRCSGTFQSYLNKHQHVSLRSKSVQFNCLSLSNQWFIPLHSASSTWSLPAIAKAMVQPD